jgi:hypothetical protein
MSTPKTATIVGIVGQDAVAKLKPSELWRTTVKPTADPPVMAFV